MKKRKKNGEAFFPSFDKKRGQKASSESKETREQIAEVKQPQLKKELTISTNAEEKNLSPSLSNKERKGTLNSIAPSEEALAPQKTTPPVEEDDFVVITKDNCTEQTTPPSLCTVM